MMHIFMFKSEASNDLRAFAGDSSGSKLPAQHGLAQGTGGSARTVCRITVAPRHRESE